MPCLHDWYEEAGITKNEYFLQDLTVARWIFKDKPLRHVDIGSRVDGFVAHVASFREIEVFDVRPVTTPVSGVLFKQVDLIGSLKKLIRKGYCDSISCLHALEHFGLGRYGDPVDPKGYEHGIANIAYLLKPGGRFYLSTPIGQERVEFNAHWVFDPRTVIQCCKANGLQLQDLSVIDRDNGTVTEVPLTEGRIVLLAENRYNLGIFTFTKLNR